MSPHETPQSPSERRGRGLSTIRASEGAMGHCKSARQHLSQRHTPLEHDLPQPRGTLRSPAALLELVRWTHPGDLRGDGSRDGATSALFVVSLLAAGEHTFAVPGFPPIERDRASTRGHPLQRRDVDVHGP